MNYTITANTEFNSLEITFDEKPSETIRKALKDLKYRWHSVKKIWYGYSDKETLEKVLAGDNTPAETHKTKKAERTENIFGVKVGDVFESSWGYEQTNVDFFQVIALVGEKSVRVREVYLPMIKQEAVSGMSADRTYKIVNDILPAAPHSVFIKDQEKGDLKRLKSYSQDGKSNPLFDLSSFASAHLITGEQTTTYESWYY